MSKPRASITDDIGDLSDFAPDAVRKPGPPPEQVKALSDAMNFPSRQAIQSAEPPLRRRYTSGRTAQIHLKTKPEYQRLFLNLCDRAGVEKQAEGFEQMVLAWERELDERDKRGR